MDDFRRCFWDVAPFHGDLLDIEVGVQIASFFPRRQHYSTLLRFQEIIGTRLGDGESPFSKYRIFGIVTDADYDVPYHTTHRRRRDCGEVVGKKNTFGNFLIISRSLKI